MDQDAIADLAGQLDSARRTARPIGQFGKQGRLFSRDEAYAIQEAGIVLRKERGERPIGLKMGLTSEGKRRQMGLDSPLYGELTDRMQINTGGALCLGDLIHPKIEPEVAFVVGRKLEGEITREEALQACSAVHACMEILDSRYEHFKYFSMEDVIADNSSSSHFVLGPPQKEFAALDLGNLGMAMAVDGKVLRRGRSDAISGDPLLSLVQLSALLARRNRSIPVGSVVLAGAATAALELDRPMEVSLSVDGLEELSIHVRP